MTGELPAAWAEAGRWPQLSGLLLAFNRLSGTLPAEWGDPSAFPFLQDLYLHGNELRGPLPDWGTPGAWPNLRWLSLFGNRLTGTLPAAWGGEQAMPQLVSLFLSNNSIAGEWFRVAARSICWSFILAASSTYVHTFCKVRVQRRLKLVSAACRSILAKFILWFDEFRLLYRKSLNLPVPKRLRPTAIVPARQRAHSKMLLWLRIRLIPYYSESIVMI